MNKVLIAGGDSFIYGSDLKDCDYTTHSKNTMSALLAKDMQYVCSASPGYSNMAIARTTILDCEKYKDKDLFVFVSWTFKNRFEFKFAYNPHQNKDDPNWCSFNSKDLDYFNFGNFKIFGSSIAQDFKPDTIKFLNMFYRHVGHDNVYEYYATLKEIVFLQNYLNVKNIPYIFTLANNFFLEPIDDENISVLLKLIDFDKWFLFDNCFGFVQWAEINKYEKRDIHPVEEAHKDAYILIKDFLNEKTNFFN